MTRRVHIIVYFTIIILSAAAGISFAQSTYFKLGTNDFTSSFDVYNSDSTTIFRAFSDGGFYINSVFGTGIIPVSGAGARVMWHPAKGAFRAGVVNSFGSTYWDEINVGNYSAAFGNNVRASGENSFAAGAASTASGSESVALGNNGTASADRTFAFNGTASGVGAVAIGSGAQATGDDALALGPSSIASGLASIVIGPSIAQGSFGVAIGLQNQAKGNFSLALGKNARASYQGVCVISDASAGFSSDSAYATDRNQMIMRFAGGFKLFTAQQLNSGVTLDAGGSSWGTVSDSTKKENFLSFDGEYFLNSLSKLKIGSWNYKVQEDTRRHYGPMAQEIFHYFGKDELGIIGNDTTLTTADMDGIMMICLQALEKRTEELQAAQEKLAKQSVTISELEEIITANNKKLSSQQVDIELIKTQLFEMKKILPASGNDDKTAVQVIKTTDN